MILTLTLAVFVVTYALIATEVVDRVAAALGGVAAMVLIGVVSAETAFFSPDTGIDWNVIFLLFGMMVIVGVLKATGLFEFLALWAVRASGGRPTRLLTLLILVTAVASALLDNVTTVLLVAPVTLSVCARLGLPTTPYLVSLVFASNIGGTATLIGDPPNIIIASRAGLTFNDFLLNTLPVAVVILALLVVMCRWLYRRQLAVLPRDVPHIDPGTALTDRPMLVRCLVVLTVVMIAFGLHAALHLDVSLVAMLGAGAMVLVTRSRSEHFLAEVEWSTLVFFMGLFILVGGLVEIGVISRLGELAVAQMGDRTFAAASALIFGSAVIGAFVDNIPYTAAMAPIVEQMVASAGPEQGRALWWSFALRADLGGNTTAVAAGANVVVIGIAAKAGHPISFWQFTRHGVVVTFASLLVAWLYVWLRYFVLA